LFRNGRLVLAHLSGKENSCLPADHSLIYLKLRDFISHEAAARLADIREK
jgi:hypothetical protein